MEVLRPHRNADEFQCNFEFAVVRVYIEDIPLLFWDFRSLFTHRFIISGPKGELLDFDI